MRLLPKLKKVSVIFCATIALTQVGKASPRYPIIEAKAYIIVDAKTGQVIAENNADVKRDPASLTKMMTSYVIGNALKTNTIYEDDIVTVTKEAWAFNNHILKGSSLMFLEPGQKIKVSELNKGIIIQSGNDACIALANFMAGSQASFVKLMNRFSHELGMTNTNFETVHGLDAPSQYTTARDMAILGRALIDNLPNEYAIYKEKEFTFNGIKQLNRNKLLWNTALNVDGIKTGHTNQAGYNLVASAIENETRLISVVLGASSEKNREEDSKRLLRWGFKFFETIRPLTANKIVAEENIWYGKSSKIKIGVEKDLFLTIPKNTKNKLTTEYQINDDLIAPINSNTVVGKIIYKLDNNIIAEKPLVTLESVEEANIFSKIYDYFKFKIHQWIN